MMRAKVTLFYSGEQETRATRRLRLVFSRKPERKLALILLSKLEGRTKCCEECKKSWVILDPRYAWDWQDCPGCHDFTSCKGGCWDYVP